MRRSVFAIISAFSTLICLGACAVFIRSYYVTDLLVSNTPGHRSARYSPRELSIARMSGKLLARHNFSFFRRLVVTGRGGITVQWLKWNHHGMDGEFFPLDNDFEKLLSDPSDNVIWWHPLHRWEIRPACYPTMDYDPRMRGSFATGFGFQIAVGQTTLDHDLVGTCEYKSVTLPLWFISGITGIPSLSLIAGSLRRRRRNALGYCVRCGYDLRASTALCPECGTLFKSD